MTTMITAKRTHDLGTSVPSNKPQPAESHEFVSRIAGPEEIEQMLSKYDKKLKPQQSFPKAKSRQAQLREEQGA